MIDRLSITFCVWWWLDWTGLRRHVPRHGRVASGSSSSSAIHLYTRSCDLDRARRKGEVANYMYTVRKEESLGLGDEQEGNESTPFFES